MNSVIEVLEFLGYDEIRLRGGDWCALSGIDEALGTTDETRIIQDKNRPKIRLVDSKTEKEIGQARQSTPVGQT